MENQGIMLNIISCLSLCPYLLLCEAYSITNLSPYIIQVGFDHLFGFCNLNVPATKLLKQKQETDYTTIDTHSPRNGAFLTLKAPPIICSRRQLQILPLFQK